MGRNMIEEILKDIPIVVTGIDGSKINEAGLSMRWSVTNECWIVGYGTRVKANNKGAGTGATLKFAINDFIEKQKQFH